MTQAATPIGTRARRARRVGLSLAAAVLLAGCQSDAPGSDAGVASATPVSAAAAGFPRTEQEAVLSIAPMLERTTPAIANIAVSFTVPAPTHGIFRDPVIRRFFGIPEDLPPLQRVSAGSGVIVDAARGLVVTNAHVVEDADTVTVRLKDRRVFAAEIVGSDPETDVAVLRIPADGLTAIPFADSDAIAVGDYAVAIGNPFGLGQTVTTGIVSALGRSGLIEGGYETFIQTDAAINPGNSGGALVNSRGELIGINTAILSRSGVNAGLNFAIPSNVAGAVVDQFARFGDIRRGRIGVEIVDLPPDVAAALASGDGEGAVIAGVRPGSPADRAGLRPGDIVLSVNGAKVRNAADLRARIGSLRVGDRVTLSWLRDGAPASGPITVGP